MKSTAAFITLVLLGCVAWGPGALADDRPPNIILILTDDLGYGDVGVYNQLARCGQGLNCIQTPRIDQMAAQGMLFTDMYASAPVCTPARSCILTGYHAGHSSVRENVLPINDPLRREDITVAEVLKRADYATAHIGKWTLGGADPDHNRVNVFGSPENKGFDLAYGYLASEHTWDYYTDRLWRNGLLEFYPENQIPAGACTQKVTFSQDLFTQEALQFIDAHASEPFFIYLCYNIPHKWNVAPDFGPYAGESWPTIEKYFASQITYLDSYVGQILDRLAQLGIDDDTLVIFTSDNGPQQTDTPNCGNHSAGFFDSNAFLRGIKRDVHEGGIRVPFIAWWPGTIAGGSVSDYIGSFEDFLPTAAELAGVKAPSGIDGVSYVPTLTGAGTQVVRPYYYFAYQSNGVITGRAVRSGPLKAVWAGSGPELYDLSADPGESSNLAGDPNLAPVLSQLTQYRDEAHWDGAPPVTSPITALVGDVVGGGTNYTLNFGTLVLNGAPVSATIRVRNDATAYSNLLEGTVDFQFSDARLQAVDGDYAWLVDGGESDEFTVTVNPTSVGPLSAQLVLITGNKYAYGTPAVNGLITLTVTGTVIGDDCNGNGVPDACDVSCAGACATGFPDDCGQSADCQGDGIPDECQLAGNDCNLDGVPDDCQLAGNDCNANGVPDECDIVSGTSEDSNGNSVPDECEPTCFGDLNGDSIVDFDDATTLFASMGLYGSATYEDGDLNFDAAVDIADAATMQIVFGTNCGTPPQGYWRFEEASGMALNSAGPAQDADNMYGSVRSSDVPVTPIPGNGLTNTRALLPGGSASGYGVRVPDPAHVLYFGDSDFTVEGWVQLASLSAGVSRQYFVQNKGLAVDGRYMDYSVLVQAGNAQCCVDNNYGKLAGVTGRELMLILGKGNNGTEGTWAVTSNLEITDFAWHHFSVAYDTGNDLVRFTLDSQVDTQAFTQQARGGVSTNSGPLLIGAHTTTSGGSNQWVDGAIDEVRITSGVVPINQLLNAP